MRRKIQLAFTRWFERDYGWMLKTGGIRAREGGAVLGALLAGRVPSGWRQRALSGSWRGCWELRRVAGRNDVVIFRRVGAVIQLVGWGWPADFYWPGDFDPWKETLPPGTGLLRRVRVVVKSWWHGGAR